MKPFIDPAFWSDPDIESAKSGVKLAALWLITNSQTSLLGLCGASVQRFQFETGLPAEALDNALKALPRAFVRIGNTIFVRNYVRHQFGVGEKLMRNNFFVALKSLFTAVKDADLRKQIASDYPELEQSTKGFEGLNKPKGREGKDMQGKGSAEGKHAGPIPTLEEAMEYGRELKMTPEDVSAWFDHFQSNGWRVSGKTPMKDWQAALRNGSRRKDDFRTLNGNGSAAPAPPKGDPPRWREFLASYPPPNDAYREHRLSPFLHPDFSRWEKANPLPK